MKSNWTDPGFSITGNDLCHIRKLDYQVLQSSSQIKCEVLFEMLISKGKLSLSLLDFYMQHLQNAFRIWQDCAVIVLQEAREGLAKDKPFNI